MIIVELSFANVMQAALVGVMRQVTNVRDKRKHRYGATNEETWDMNINGAIGELALAKHLGWYWDGALGNFKADDVGHHQVRATTWENGRLLIHHEDKDDRKFVLVTLHDMPCVTLAGWMLGQDAKDPAYWAEPRRGRGCYAVPQEMLRPMEEL